VVFVCIGIPLGQVPVRYVAFINYVAKFQLPGEDRMSAIASGLTHEVPVSSLMEKTLSLSIQ
jgi:hypothetical protein